jgi:hypothetical protein
MAPSWSIDGLQYFPDMVVAVGGWGLGKRRGCGLASGAAPRERLLIPRQPAGRERQFEGLNCSITGARLAVLDCAGRGGREPGRNLAVRYWIEPGWGAICLESIQLRIFYTLHIRPDYIPGSIGGYGGGGGCWTDWAVFGRSSTSHHCSVHNQSRQVFCILHSAFCILHPASRSTSRLLLRRHKPPQGS